MQKYVKHAKMAEKKAKNTIFFVKIFDIYEKCCIFAQNFRECR